MKVQVIGITKILSDYTHGKTSQQELGRADCHREVGVESVTKASREGQSQVTSSGAHRVSVQTLNDSDQGALGLIL